jgi:hypothetical protein
MTITIAPKAANRRRPLVFLVIAVAVLGLAGFVGTTALAAPSKVHHLTSQESLEVLRTAFGAVAERPIREGRVAVAPTSAAILALSDDVNIRNRAYNPRTGRTWSAGDSATAWPLGIRGFTDVMTGDVYINAEVAIETTTPHELLHSNVASDFPEMLGLSLYEGATEQLALDALRASRRAVPKLPEYPEERNLVAEVIRIAGADVLVRAYLNGGSDLTRLVEAIGQETLAKVKSEAAAGDLGGALSVLQTVHAGR